MDEIRGTDNLTNNLIDNLHELELAIGQAPLEGKDFLEVTDRVYTHLCKDPGSQACFLYKGIKIFKEGGRDPWEKDQRMTLSDLEERIKSKGK